MQDVLILWGFAGGDNLWLDHGVVHSEDVNATPSLQRDAQPGLLNGHLFNGGGAVAVCFEGLLREHVLAAWSGQPRMPPRERQHEGLGGIGGLFCGLEWSNCTGKGLDLRSSQTRIPPHLGDGTSGVFGLGDCFTCSIAG